MEIVTSTIATATTTTASVKTPEPESEAPSRIQPAKALSFTNGVLKRHHHLSTATPPPVTYGECQKNHAAAIGGHAVDGCGEFMPSPTATPTDPTSLKCAACGCHRNFHRRDPDYPPPQHVIEYHPHHRHHPPPPPHGGHCSPNSSSPPPISSSYYPSAPHMLLALSAGLPGHPPETHPSLAAPGAGNSSGRKRFRTKFTQDQKDRMLEFAERIGWKVQKRDDDLIASFCSEVGIERGVLKVWMHNNKNTMGKRDLSNDNNNNNNNNNNVVITGATEVDTTTQSHHQHNHDNGDINYGQDPTHHHQFHNSNDSASTHVAPNGSSSSS